MRVEELHLKNFRCFKELDIKFPASNLAVFIGLNGAGKTAILDAIAIGLNDFIEKKKQHFNNISGLKYYFDDVYYRSSLTENEIVFKYKDREIRHQSHFDKTEENKQNKPVSDEEKLHPYIVDIEEGIFFDYGFLCVHYKIDRKSNIHVLSEESNQEGFRELYNWLNNELGFENDFKIDSGNIHFSNPRLNVVRKAMSTFFKNITDAEFSNLRYRRNIKDSHQEEMAKRNFDLYITIKEKELKIYQLSEGQRLLINIVCDIARQLLKIQKMDVVIETPILDEEGNFLEWDYDYPTYSEEQIEIVLERQGVVLIDEIELHLHPQWQREVLPALQKTFPNCQFIVTTHSPQVLSNIEKEQVFIIEDGALVKFTPHTQGRDSNSILYELFGVKERPEFYQDKINAFYDVLEAEKMDEAEKMLAELTELFGEEDTEVVRAKVHLTFATE